MIFGNLVGKRVLVVEDDYMQASDLAAILKGQGSEVVGPCPDVSCGQAAVLGGQLDAAILDIKLGSDLVFRLADDLARLDVPFMFVTGYDGYAIPEHFRHVHRLLKPATPDQIAVALAIVVAANETRH